jgi:hypothetical protein
MEINGLASMTISENKAEVGQNVLSKTLQKTAEVEQQQNRQLQMQSPKSSTTVAEVSGKGTKIDAYV